MEQENFGNIILRPHWMQYGLCKLPDILGCLVLCLMLFFIENSIIRSLLGIITVGLLLYIIYSIADMCRIRYVITGEQLLYKHGVFAYTTDYIEMYRIYDYQQVRTPLQQITGLKTVVVMANDRLNPSLSMIGIENEKDVVAIIRRRVEYNKQMKNVYEIGNRY